MLAAGDLAREEHGVPRPFRSGTYDTTGRRAFSKGYLPLCPLRGRVFESEAFIVTFGVDPAEK